MRERESGKSGESAVDKNVEYTRTEELSQKRREAHHNAPHLITLQHITSMTIYSKADYYEFDIEHGR